jgi:hypothetical protein
VGKLRRVAVVAAAGQAVVVGTLVAGPAAAAAAAAAALEMEIQFPRSEIVELPPLAQTLAATLTDAAGSAGSTG